jgi:formylglycine-generating enzyme required for sulfatase activity
MTATSRPAAILFTLAMCVAALCVSSASAEEGSAFVKQDTWQDTMVASRARLLEGAADLQVQLGPWHTSGPLKAKDFGQALLPEREVNLEAKVADGKPMWTEHAEWADGAVHNLPGGSSVSTYLYRTITTAGVTRLAARFGSDDGLKVWLNGAEVLAQDVPRVVAPDQASAALNLKQGENHLLLKIYNRTGGHAFYFASDVDPVPGLWSSVAKAFPAEAAAMKRDLPNNGHLAWFNKAGDVSVEKKIIECALAELGAAGDPVRKEFDALVQANAVPGDPRWLALYAGPIALRNDLRAARADFERIQLDPLRRAICDLTETFADTYPKGGEYLQRLDGYAQTLPDIKASLDRGEIAHVAKIGEIIAFQREPLQANPLLDFEKLLVVKRKANRLGLPQNWQGNCSMAATGYDNEIAVMTPVASGGQLTTFYKPEDTKFVGDVDLHFDADRMLFSMLGSHDHWQIWEIKADGTGLRQVTPGEHPDVHNYDACYLPDDRIIFDSTRVFQGIPCVTGSDNVANLFTMNPDGTGIRQLCFDQDHDWCPTVLNNGRLMYTRWEYSDTPHYFSRLLFHMNPDGTGQMEYYGSNSFWPNSTFYARPIPNHPTKIVAIVSGHHGVPRMGELVIFDPAKGRFEGDGAVQRIPGYGESVDPIIVDQLVNSSWPRFLHPYPLSDKYFLVSCQPNPSAPWGIYVADVFDNLLPLAEVPGYALFEPVPFRKTPKPPVIPEKVRPEEKDATIYLADVYRGGGLAGVPRGTVKKLRVYAFHYSYPKMGGHMHVGMEGPWDVHQIMGTVPVLDDGSAAFTVPANTPIAVQPLDAEGKALQVMRSWFTAMPGEVLSCVGCHESQNSGPPSKPTMAAQGVPYDITPWYGPTRGFSFKREVQPVLDKHCVGCHNAEREGSLDFTAKAENGWNNLTPSYLALHPYVRRPGPESDYHLPAPLEFHADTSILVQMLMKGHKGVKLDDESWDRLVTWIDLNVPDHGTWGEHRDIASNYHQRRIEMRTRYANRPEDPELIPAIQRDPVEFVAPQPMAGPVAVSCAGWPFSAEEAKQRQAASSTGDAAMRLDLGNGVAMDLVRIPAGEFVMGGMRGPSDVRPLAAVAIDKPFWMGTVEVTNQQFQQFDTAHFNGYFDQHNKDHTRPGYSADSPAQPAMRVSWEKAMAFCKWLSEKTGKTCTLPTEAQWEWACRAGADTAMNYGDLGADFSTHGNMADESIKLLAVAGIDPSPIKNPNQYMDFLPKDPRSNDGQRLMCDVGQYQPNVWGLHDMHGNVWEWTRSDYRPYPYAGNDGRNGLSATEKKVARGGSWRDKPKWATASFRLGYRPYQRVFNVGFRVVIQDEGDPVVVASR